MSHKPCWGEHNDRNFKCYECDDSYLCRRVKAQPHRGRVYGRKVA